MQAARTSRMTLALILSLGAHGLGAGLLFSGALLPSIDIDLQFPSEVEFGLIEGSEVQIPAEQSEQATDTKPAEAPTEAAEVGKAEAAEGKDNAAPESHPEDKAKSALDGDAQQLSMPSGAQIALRVDMETVSKTPLSEDVTLLLNAIPDWKALLSGSGVHPVSDLKSLLIASPNLQREKLLIAGSHRGGKKAVEEAATLLAESQGATLQWTERFGFPSANWANIDKTQRIVTVFDEEHFALCREEDLAKLIAAAQLRDQEHSDPRKEPSTSSMEGLLSLDEGVILSLEIENARLFVANRYPQAPARLHALIKTPKDGIVSVRIRGQFPTVLERQNALVFWKQARDNYAARIDALGVFGMGMAAPIRALQFSEQGRWIDLTGSLTLDQCRLLLSLIQERLRGTRHP
ncbi:MAG: hypothetical protein IPJ88_14035 [Myxococcales bacterium]|nr:MAG: hypothetical protein IPJ88_14035 [Myxococcales bacterium]